jgi:hypothetical protein
MDIFIPTMLKYGYTVAVVFVMGRVFYYPNRGNKEFLFTYILLAAIIALICVMVKRVELSLGFALGIFAIFSIIRYRTTPISPREMTYIFLSAGIAAKNSLVPDDIGFWKLVISDISLLLLIGLLEYFLFRQKLSTKKMIYSNMELIHPDRREDLKNDLNQRFGISHIEKIKVGRIDSQKNAARLLIYFKDPDKNNFEDE